MPDGRAWFGCPSRPRGFRRPPLDVAADRAAHAGRQQILRGVVAPRLHDQHGGFRHGFRHRTDGESRSFGEPADPVAAQAVHVAPPAQGQGKVVPGKTGEGRHEIVGRCQRRRAAVGVEDRPVLEMHVAVAGQRHEHESPHVFFDPRGAGLGREHGGDAGMGDAFVLAVGRPAEYLSEILHVDAAVGSAVEAPHGERPSLQLVRLLGQIRDVARSLEAGLGHVNADSAGEFHTWRTRFRRSPGNAETAA